MSDAVFDAPNESPEAQIVSLYATAPTRDVALDLARRLVDARLAACVNILPGATSCYVWQGDVCVEDEVVMFCKTSRALAPLAIDLLRQHHPYSLPGLLVLPVLGGLPDYMAWLHGQLLPHAQA